MTGVEAGPTARTPFADAAAGRAAGGGVRLENISKSYGGSRVLDGVDLDLRPGTVHGLVGQNGAGKSTLMKILSGAVRPDAGGMFVDDQPVTLRRPADALALGIGLISQELAAVPAMTVLDNVFLGAWASKYTWARPRGDRAQFERLCQDVGFRLDASKPMGELVIAEQQQVEILRAVARGTRVLIMDEPTAVLTETETAALLRLVRRLAERGTTVVLISHFLEEVLEVSDVITVLRDGRHVLTGAAHKHTPTSLVEAMTGEPVDVLYPAVEPPSAESPVILRVENLRRGDAVRGIDLTVRAGEIVGLAGLVGSGRSELARLVFGADQADAGAIEVDGVRLRQGSPRAAMKAGIAMVPESRKEQGLLLAHSVAANVTLASLTENSRLGFRRASEERRMTERCTDRLQVRSSDPRGPVWTLSGGNQQKVLFAKWLARRPRLLIVDEPTRGVDISTKVQIHRLICELAESGMGVLLISSELEEVLALSHRVAVLRQGRIVTTLTGAEATPGRVLAAAFADER